MLRVLVGWIKVLSQARKTQNDPCLERKSQPLARSIILILETFFEQACFDYGNFAF